MLKLYYGTQAQYTAATKDTEALYFITDTQKLYKGSTDFSSAARVVASMPASPAKDIVYFDQSDSKVKVFDGSSTHVIALPASALVGSGSTDNTVATSKAVYDAVKDLAPLASPALTGVPTTPTATAASNNTQIANTAYVKGEIDSALASIAGALHFKGVVATVADLPASGNTEGDVYQVQTNPQGTDAEYVWTVNASTSAGEWVELGAVIDLSAYATKAQCDTYYDAIGAAAAVLGTSGDAASAATVYGAKAYADSLATNYDAAGSAATAAAGVVGSSGDAATANTVYGAKAYADSLASNYDAAGAASTAAAGVVGSSGDAASANTVYGAKAYADSLATNYDAAGSAATAKSDVIGASGDLASADTIYGAKAYADSVAAAAVTWNALS